MVDSLIISIDTTNGKDNTVLIVGRKRPTQEMEIVNAFQGEEALKLYSQLTVKMEGRCIEWNTYIRKLISQSIVLCVRKQIHMRRKTHVTNV